MKIVVTGGSGFVGKYVVNQLKVDGHEVKALDIAPNGSEETYKVDVTKPLQIKSALELFEPEIVVHLAALAGSTGKGGGAESLKDPYRYFNVNINGTLNVYEACRQLGISKVICMSSFSPYGFAPCPINEETPFHPNNPYGGSKACVEEIAKVYSSNYGVRTVIFRPPLICGEGQNEVNALREFVTCALLDTPIVILGEGKHVREFVHPLDVARAISAGIQCISRMTVPYEIFVLGNRPIRMIDLAELIVSRVGNGSVVFKRATGLVFDQFTDHEKAMRVMGWKPRIGIEEIVGRVISDIKTRQSMSSLEQAAEIRTT
ncbi:MAG TPA: NAD(P)-dependent oxidoreductase [Nitrososphaerales archaeon]|nr:NAD(P)-dependent oxidoreductase [Nitrososphaerales archaeon]